MPTIQSKRYPDNIQFIDSEGWENFRRLGKDRNFKIIDDNDLQETVIPTPERIIELAEPIEVEKIELTKKEIIEELDKLEVDYNSKLTKVELLEILKESNND